MQEPCGISRCAVLLAVLPIPRGPTSEAVDLTAAELADAIDQAATAEGTTVSAWIADTAAHRLRIDAGRHGVAEWERQHGALTPDELADGLARTRAMLRRQQARKSA